MRDGHPSGSWVRREQERFLLAHRELVGGVVLNLGGGSKPYRELFARQVNADRGAAPGVDVVCDADAAFPFRDAAFDGVLCLNLLEHVPRPAFTLAEARRVLRPAGRILVFTPFIYEVHPDPRDYWRFAPDGLRLLFDGAGLDVEGLAEIGGRFTTLSMVVARMRWLVRRAYVPLAPRLMRLDAREPGARGWANGYFIWGRPRRGRPRPA